MRTRDSSSRKLLLCFTSPRVFLSQFYWKQINEVTNFLLPSHVIGPKLMVWMIHTTSSTNFLTGSWNFKCWH